MCLEEPWVFRVLADVELIASAGVLREGLTFGEGLAVGVIAPREVIEDELADGRVQNRLCNRIVRCERHCDVQAIRVVELVVVVEVQVLHRGEDVDIFLLHEYVEFQVCVEKGDH